MDFASGGCVVSVTNTHDDESQPSDARWLQHNSDKPSNHHCNFCVCCILQDQVKLQLSLNWQLPHMPTKFILPEYIHGEGWHRVILITNKIITAVSADSTWTCFTHFYNTLSSNCIKVNIKTMTSSNPVTTVASKVHNSLFSGSNPPRRRGLISEMMGAILATTDVTIFWAGAVVAVPSLFF